MNLLNFIAQYPDEDSCIQKFKEVRDKAGIVCRKCKGTEHYWKKDKLQYECKKCNHTFDLFQSITAKPLQKCPKCKGSVRRLIGRGAGIIFKGSGFYQTDYRSENYKKGAGAEKKSAGPAAGAEAKKSTVKKDKTATQEKHVK